MKRNIFLLFVMVFFCGACADFLDMPPKNTKVVYTISDVRDAMSTLLFATTSSSYCKGYVSNGVRFNDEYVQYPFTRRNNVSSILYTNDLDMVNFLFDDFANPARGGQNFVKEYGEIKNWEGYLFPSELWKEVFVSIGYINMVLKDLENVPDYNKTDGERISGEARVIRAYYLLRLNQLFAPYDKNEYGIPFNFDADVVQGGKRWKQTDLYAKLIGELMDVLAYETVPDEAWNIFFNKRIIYAILAQTYQFKAESCAAEDDDWSKAETYAREARDGARIENTVDEQKELNYAPADQAYYTLDKPHQFALLRIAHPGDGGNNYAPWGTPSDPQQRVNPELFAMYDAEDIRVSVFFKIINNTPYWVKLQSRGSVDVCSETHPLFRYSDLLLIEAEAKARQNAPEALLLLNEFKSSKIPGYAGFQGSNVLDEILRERRKEFALEEQMRWLDMKRLRVSVTREALDDDNMSQFYTLEANDYRYALPIPEEAELMYNNISQNPGWPASKED